MSKNLTVQDEIYPYPEQGDTNYAEAATGWAEGVTDVLSVVSGPGDIPTTEVPLSGTSDGTYTTGTITNLKFDTAYVQTIEVTGFITRTYTDATPDEVEDFTIEGVYNGTEIDYGARYVGTDTEFEFLVSGGQFTFSYLDKPNTDTVTIKFQAKTIVDSEYFD